MTSALALELVRRAVMLCLLVGGPLLLTALVIGVVVSLFQAVTQLQEQTLSFIPKLIGVGLVLVLSLPWMMRQLIEYLVQMLHTMMLAGT
jgi:flagellar biosynthesis protein FliQ